jgi:PTS system ascorbate-specific IIA component
MTQCIFIIAHAPLAQAMRDCALHVYPECAANLIALDVLPNAQPEDTLAQARQVLASAEVVGEGLLVLTDIFGGTPANVAQKLVSNNKNAKLIAGINLPMLYRAVCYRHESLDALVTRALVGGTQGVMQVANTPLQH